MPAMGTETARLREDDSSEKILVIEDDRIARSELAKFISNKGLKVRKSNVGKRGFHEAIKDLSIKVIVSDIAMPGELDGIDAAVRAQRARPEVSLIFVTAFAENQDYRRRVFRSGIHVAAWFQKPLTRFRLDDLLSCICRELSKVRIREVVNDLRESGFDLDSTLQVISSYNDALPVKQRVEPALFTEIRKESHFVSDDEIDLVYRELEDILENKKNSGEAAKRVAGLKDKLIALQEDEAARIALSIYQNNLIKPGSGYAILKELKGK